MRAVENSTAFSTLVGIWPLLAPALLAIYGNPVKGLQTFTRRLIARAASSDTSVKQINGSTFLEKVDNAREKDPEGYKYYHMHVACEGNVAAGSDTTSISLTSALFYILTTPGAVDKLRDEIFAAAGPETTEKPITFDEAIKLPYLQYCIKEALRLHPATGLPMWREVVGEDVDLAGTSFPPRVGCSCVVLVIKIG